ncbi:calcium-binding protein [Rhizobium herbae]
METLNYYYTNSQYPLGLDYNPGLEELLGSGQTTPIGANTSTQATFRLENGLTLKARGTGFVSDADGDLTDAGTLTSLEVLSADGKTLLQKLTVSVSMELFTDAYPFADRLVSWLLNRADTITGSSGSDDIYGHGGNDIINAGAGDDDFVEGGEGKDTYDGGVGVADQLSFKDAYFNVNAYRGIQLDSTLGTVIDPYGNSETFQNFESFRGTQFADSFKGSARDEQFMGLGGKDTIDGGGGFDVVRYHRDNNFVGGSAGVTVNLATGTAIDGFGRTDTLISIEGVRGTIFNDKITGSSVANRMEGDAGNDILDGGSGVDVLNGGLGNDTLKGGAGADTLRGGAGNDAYDIDNAGDIVDEGVAGSSGTDRVTSTVSFNLSDAAHAIGSIENLTFVGASVVNGTGNALANAIVGNSAVNILNGVAGNDSINGGAGNDTIYGGIGIDTLTGGLGIDRFVFNTAPNAATNLDRITDFTVVDDNIALENAVFTAIAGVGALTAAQFVSNAGGTATNANHRIIYETDTGKLFYDSNGSVAGGSVQFATLSAGLALTNADFFVI